MGSADTAKAHSRRFAGRPLWQHLLAMGLILAVAAGLFLWAGYTYLPDATGTWRRQIVNDDYDALTQPLAAGGEIRQSLEVQGRLYGLRLNVTTYNRVARGTLHLRLLDAQGAQVAACDTDMTLLLDNTFHLFLFDGMVDAGAGGQYTLVLSATPATTEDVLGFHRSSGPAQSYVEEDETRPAYPLDSFELRQDGRVEEATLALQYITRYAGGFILRAYSFFAALLCCFLLALYALLFMFPQPLHRVFVLCALVLGFVFVFLTPLRTAPDEYVHIASSYHYTNRLLGTARGDGNGQLMVRAGDEMMLNNYDFDATDIFAWQDVYENLFERTPGGDMVPVPARINPGYLPMYLPQVLGLALARLLGLGRVGLLLLGRLANLVFFTAVTSRAVKRMPLAKPMLFVAGLLPMTLQLAGSFSYDTYVIALAFYFTACCLDYGLARKAVGLPQMIWLGVLAVLLAPAKTVYLVVILFLFVIPAAKYPSKRACIIARAAILGAALVAWALVNAGSALQTVDLSVTPEEATAAAQAAAATPATDYGPGGPAVWSHASTRFTLPYVLGNIPQTLRLVLRTLWEQGPLWLQGLIGGRLGEIIAIDLEVNWLFVIGLLGVLLCSALPDEGDRQLLSRRGRLGGLTIAGLAFLLFMAACITWTPTDYTTIFGIQGRYLLPVLPLLLLALRGRNLAFQKPVWPKLAFAAPALTLLCQLNGFILILGRG